VVKKARYASAIENFRKNAQLILRVKCIVRSIKL